jgi:hypothetical protein
MSAYLAAGALIVGNVAGILSNIEDIRSVVFKWFDLGGLLAALTISRVLIASSMELFFAIAAYWFYRLYIRNNTRLLNIAFWVGVCIAIPGIAFLSARMVSDQAPIDLLLRQETHFADRVWEQQVRNGPGAGGLRFSLKGTTEEPQPWTTAQGVVGVLAAHELSEQDSARVRSAFDYLERVRVAGQGWGYFAGNTRGVTEINAWIALANILSLRPDQTNPVWAGGPAADALARVRRDLDEILIRQHEDGCFSPIRGTTQLNQTRTYSTVMALWALSESRSNPLIRSQPWWNYDESIRSAIQCLMRHRTDNDTGFGGWWPALGVKDPSGVYPGLTAQVIYVLYGSGEHFDLLSNDPRFSEAVSEFLKAALNGVGRFGPIKDRDVSDNDRTHDSYRYLPNTQDFQVESSTFLWYPWTLAAASRIAEDGTRPVQVRRDAKRLATSLIQKSGELTTFVNSDEGLYPTAEGLFGFGVYTSSALATKRSR